MRVPYPEESWVLSLYLAKKGTLKLAVFKHWSGFRSLLTLTFAAFVAVVVINGGVSVAVRFSYVELPTFWGATLRVGAATIILWVLRQEPRYLKILNQELRKNNHTMMGLFFIGLYLTL